MPATAKITPDEQATFGCIYLVRNRVSGTVYVGQTRRRLSYRWSLHCSDAKRRPKTIFHKAIRSYGPDAFDVSILQTANSVEELNRLEAEWITRLQASQRGIGYNQTTGGLNFERTPEYCARLSAALRGRRLSDQHRMRLSEIRRGRRQSPEHIARRRAALIGRTPSPQCRRAVAEANRHRIITDATRTKLSAATKKRNEVRWGRT